MIITRIEERVVFYQPEDMKDYKMALSTNDDGEHGEHVAGRFRLNEIINALVVKSKKNRLRRFTY